jgi:hypothetical protein
MQEVYLGAFPARLRRTSGVIRRGRSRAEQDEQRDSVCATDCSWVSEERARCQANGWIWAVPCPSPCDRPVLATSGSTRPTTVLRTFPERTFMGSSPAHSDTAKIGQDSKRSTCLRQAVAKMRLNILGQEATALEELFRCLVADGNHRAAFAVTERTVRRQYCIHQSAGIARSFP